MKRAIVCLLVVAASTGCGLHTKMAAVETAGRVGGEYLADTTRAEYGLHSPEMRRVGEIGMAMDQATVVLAGTDEITPLDGLVIRQVVTRMWSAIQGSDPPDSVRSAVESVLDRVANYLRDANHSQSARVLSQMFTGSAGLAIRERLDLWRAMEAAEEGGTSDGN